MSIRRVGWYYLAMSLVLCLAVPAAICPAGAATQATGSTTAGDEVAVTNIAISPEIFMSGDAGTLVVKVTNNGDQSIGINRAEVYSNDLKVINYQTYDKVGRLGPGVSMEFTFSVRANAKDGVYFPTFYIDFQDAGSMRYPIPVKIDGSQILISVVDAPDSFIKGQKNQVTLAVFNPRDNAVNSVSVTVSGEAVTSKQTAIFLGTLDVDETRNVTFEIVPEESADLAFNVSYRNGLNTHFSTLVVPMTVGDRSTRAELVVNSIELSSSGGTYTLEGDVTNAGLEDAKSIVVTVASPAIPVDPTRVSVIGSLEPDDFSTFEVTFTAQDSGTIPLLITYKDEDGNSFTATEEIALGSGGMPAAGTGSQASAGGYPGSDAQRTGGNLRRPGTFVFGGGGFGGLPILGMAMVVAVGGILIVLWRKGVLGRVRDRFRK